MISFASATGNIFNRLGKLGLLVSEIESYQQVQLANMTDTTNGVVAQFNTESDIQAIMGSSYISNLTGPETAASTAQQMAVATVNRMVFRDIPQLNQTLTSDNTVQSISEIILQMQVAGASVLAMTIGSSTTAFIGNGNGVMNVSTKRPLDGLVLENSFAEQVTLTCSSDSFSGGAVPMNEGFTVTGEGSQTDLFAFNWPLGSNGQASLNAINGDANNASGNLLTNSGFLTFTTTANVPNNFTLLVGTPGVNLFQENSIIYTPGSALKLVGDGTTKVSLTQIFNTTTGTQGQLAAQTQYSFCVFLRCGPTPPASGVLTFQLIDQNGNVVQDANGVANIINVNANGLNTVYTGYTGVFRTPVIMPTTISLQLVESTALPNNAIVYLDKMSLGEMTQLYTSGPFFAVHSGSILFVQNDYGIATITNSRGAGGTLDTFQTLLYRLLDPYIASNEFLFPSSPTPTVKDNLISFT